MLEEVQGRQPRLGFFAGRGDLPYVGRAAG